MKLLSRVALFLGRHAPRGGWRAVRFAAARDPALWDHPVPLPAVPGAVLRADLRETVSMNFLRHGCIPGMEGHDLLFRRLIAPGDTVFDIGANVGYTALLFASLAGPKGRVVALEPGRRAYAALARNAAQAANLAILQIAASDHEGEAQFHEAEMSDLSSLEPVAGATSFTVPVEPLDRVAAREGAPAFVKIDVEGHEPAVLRGMAELFASARPPLVLFEALDPAALDRCAAVISRLARPDGKLFRLRHDGALSADLAAPGHNDYLHAPAWAEARLAG